jgi:uncharacterized protein
VGHGVFHEIVAIWLELSPWFLLGMLISGLLHGFVPKDFLKRQLRGRWAPIKAVALGVPLPLCSCGVIPAAVGIKKDGASDGAAIGFLISTPQTGVDSILVSASFLGWPFAIFKVFSAALTGVIGGMLTRALGSKDMNRTSNGIDVPAAQEEMPRGREKIRAMTQHSLEVLSTIWHWLIIGVIASAAISTLIPASAWQTVSSWGFLGSASIVLLISVPLYVCATASVPIAAALVAGGMPLGAALVFLMAGPATNLATMGTIIRTFGKRVFAVYLGTIAVGSLALGKLFDFVLNPQLGAVTEHHHGGAHWLESVSGVALFILVVGFAAADLRSRLSSRKAAGADSIQKTELPIGGMTCGGCVKKVHQLIASQEGVKAVSVDLDTESATIVGAFDTQKLEQALSQAGFKLLEQPIGENQV